MSRAGWHPGLDCQHELTRDLLQKLKVCFGITVSLTAEDNEHTNALAARNHRDGAIRADALVDIGLFNRKLEFP